MINDLLRLWRRLRLRIMSVRLLVRIKRLRVWLLVSVVVPVAGHQSLRLTPNDYKATGRSAALFSADEKIIKNHENHSSITK
jgi:hypothetical protein